MYLGRIWKLTNKLSKFGEVWVVSKDKLWNVSTSFRHLILHLNFLEKSLHDRMHWWSGLLYIYCTRPVPASLLSSSPLWGGQNVASSSTLGPCSSWSTPFLVGRDSTAWFEQATREVWQLELSNLDESMFIFVLFWFVVVVVVVDDDDDNKEDVQENNTFIWEVEAELNLDDEFAW